MQIMQVGITLCHELLQFLSPMDTTGKMMTQVAGRRREMLYSFGVLESLLKVLFFCFSFLSFAVFCLAFFLF